MQKVFYSAGLVIIVASCLTMLMSLKTGMVQESNMPVGAVIHSILPPDLMDRQYPGEWALLDGKPLAESTALYSFLNQEARLDLLSRRDSLVNLLPDARGVFIRGMNIGKDGAIGDVDGDRALGSYQVDAFQGHRHFNSPTVLTTFSQQSPNNPHQRNTVTGTTDNTAGSVDGGYGAPRLSSETRPRNITLYTYVKVGNIQ